MIGKRGKLMILLYVIFLAVLFLMCSTDLIIREPEKEIYQIAVIIEDVRDDNYSNFKKGMDQAAVEFNADVRFITLYEKLDTRQQLELIEREQQDGTDALIVVPADEEQVIAALAGKKVTVPVVLLSSGLTGEGVTGNVDIDYKDMGKYLAERMAEHMTKDVPVLIASSPESQSMMSRNFLDGAGGALSEMGYECQIVDYDRQKMGEIPERFGKRTGTKTAILAESPEILAEMAGFLADNPSCRDAVQGLFGRGSTWPILNYLDRGLITGICVTDEFSIGYFSVYMAVQGLEGYGKQTPREVDFHYIEKEDLRDPAYEKMLFPIE